MAGFTAEVEFQPHQFVGAGHGFGLDDALVEQLKSHQILYDRDGEAEYFQFYSRAFARRVFFEVVQRRGYQAYGAANATIRLAAQARFKTDALQPASGNPS